MDDYRNIFGSLHTNKKAAPKGSGMLSSTPPPKGKKLTKQFKKSKAYVASKAINLSKLLNK
jgi:hypothetical protein